MFVSICSVKHSRCQKGPLLTASPSAFLYFCHEMMSNKQRDSLMISSSVFWKPQLLHLIYPWCGVTVPWSERLNPMLLLTGRTVHDMTAVFFICCRLSVFCRRGTTLQNAWGLRSCLCVQASTIEQGSLNFFLLFDHKQNKLVIENKRKCLHKVRQMEKRGMKIVYQIYITNQIIKSYG